MRDCVVVRGTCHRRRKREHLLHMSSKQLRIGAGTSVSVGQHITSHWLQRQGILAVAASRCDETLSAGVLADLSITIR